MTIGTLSHLVQQLLWDNDPSTQLSSNMLTAVFLTSVDISYFGFNSVPCPACLMPLRRADLLCLMIHCAYLDLKHYAQASANWQLDHDDSSASEGAVISGYRLCDFIRFTWICFSVWPEFQWLPVATLGFQRVVLDLAKTSQWARTWHSSASQDMWW